jgi:putative tricarboxylic transport membrane protein
MILRRIKMVLVAMSVIAVSFSMAHAVQPEGNVEVVVGAPPGGGYDRMARAIQKILVDEKLINYALNVTYKPGGGGAVAWAYINRSPGDMQKLSIFSPNLITNELRGANSIRFEDVTPIATLVFEDGAFAVNSKGKINSAETLISALKNNPGQVRFGFATSAGNQWHVTFALLCEALGVDVNKVRSTVFSGASKAVAALLGGHVDVSVSGIESFNKYHQSGDLRIVALSCAKRYTGVLGKVPTWKELGYDVEFGAWRGILGPKGMTADQIQYWENLMAEVVKKPLWEPVAIKNFWRTQFLRHDATLKMLAKEREQYRKFLINLGLIK